MVASHGSPSHAANRNRTEQLIQARARPEAFSVAAETCVATEHDVDGAPATLTAAFEVDPLWSWAFPDRGLADLWRLLVSSALRYSWVWVADDYAAASVWIPAGGSS